MHAKLIIIILLWLSWRSEAQVIPMAFWYKSPTWYSVATTTTYAAAASICAGYGRRLCYRDEYCPNGHAGGEQVFGGTKSGDQWAPVLDQTNNWVAVGTGWPSCQLHTEISGGTQGLPSWSTSSSSYTFRNWLLCCG